MVLESPHRCVPFGEPYINHPARVAARLAAFVSVIRQSSQAWLHDTIDENTWVMVGFLRTARFPETVITAVESVSRVPGEVVLRPGGLRRVDPIGRYVKLADNDENSADEPCTPAGYRRRVGTLRKYVIARTQVQVAVAPSTPDRRTTAQMEMRICT